MQEEIRYSSLLDKISRIYKVGLHENYTDLNRFTLETNWKIGEQISKVEQGGDRQALYGKKVLERLAGDMTKKFEIQGFSVRNLSYMRKFHSLYPASKINYELTWTHYCQLVKIKDGKIRKKLEDEIVRHGFTYRELMILIRKKYAKYSEEETGKIERKALKFPAGKLNHYRVVFLESGDSAGSLPNVDFGFKVYYRLPPGAVSKPKNDEILEVVKAGGGFKFRRSAAEKKDLFTYKARIDRIVDGDTVVVTIDLGFGIVLKQKLRLRGIDAPELSTEEGKEAKRFVSSRLRDCGFIVIKTHSEDKYDRYLTDLLYIGGEKKEETVLEDGNFLNQDLLNEGYVELV